VPSHVVPSLTVDTEHNDVYSAYNKPGAVMYWLRVSSTLSGAYPNRLMSRHAVLTSLKVIAIFCHYYICISSTAPQRRADWSHVGFTLHALKTHAMSQHALQRS